MATLVSSLLVFPHSMSYFNCAVGGPLNGPSYLHNSNVDWGQDLLFLHRWMQRHPEARPMRVDFSGGFKADMLPFWDDDTEIRPLFGDDSAEEAQGSTDGQWYAISVGRLYDLPKRHDVYEDFRNARPETRIGYSIRVFRPQRK